MKMSPEEAARLRADMDAERAQRQHANGRETSAADTGPPAPAKGKKAKPVTERPSPFPEIEPWPDPVNGAELLDELDIAFQQFVVLPSRAAAAALALWTVHAHCFRAFPVSPRLAITSATMRCGKTRVFDVLANLVPRPMRGASLTEAVLLRVIEAHAPTVLFDETDRALGDREGLIGLINAGHSPGTPTWRCVGEGAAIEPRDFAVFTPLALAGIGKLPGTIADRAIRIEMQRKKPSETVPRLDRQAKAGLAILARKASRWAADHADRLAHARPQLPEGLDDRAADNAEPLLAVAEAVGGPWPALAREAMLTLAGAGSADADDNRVRLLWAVAEIFETDGADALTSAEIVKQLLAPDESPWRECGKGGKPLTPAQLARQLAPLGIAPERFYDKDSARQRGYIRARLEDALARYPAPRSVPVSQGPGNQDQTQSSECPIPAFRDALKHAGNADEIGVRDTRPPWGTKTLADDQLDAIDSAEAEAIRADRDKNR